jgi:DNA phosphorothioation-associated DGQHR protein 1
MPLWTGPVRRPALRVEQALGVYFVITLKAHQLLDVAYSDRLQATRSLRSDAYVLEGTQRKLEPGRLRAISDYISRIDSSFPNTIILAANFRPEDGNIEDDVALRWGIEGDDVVGWEIVIPSHAKLAAVIDGQHRLFGYPDASALRLQDDLICAVFLDLPKAVQAGLFATINSTQRPVSPSITYELFGYNIAEEPPEDWNPDKLAVYLTRRLAVDRDSPLADRIIVAPEHGEGISEPRPGAWKVSTAAVVRGILKLFSNNPKRDANFLLRDRRKSRSELQGAFDDASPLRPLYFDVNDQLSYLLIRNYLTACDTVFWKTAPDKSFITRTTGVSALLNILRLIADLAIKERNVSVQWFVDKLRPAGGTDFADARYSAASGAGEGMIRNELKRLMGL